MVNAHDCASIPSVTRISKSPIVVLLALAAFALPVSAQIGGTGWTSKTPSFKVQSPTNASLSDRYWFTNNTYHFLTYSNDGAFSVGNTTLPRTEHRYNPDYTNGDIQYQASILAPGDENSYSVFQIHTGDAQSPTYGSTTFMVFWFTNSGGSIRYYSGTVLATNLANRWFQLNVDHNVVTHTLRAWVDQRLVYTGQDNGASDFYFKAGVYEQKHGPTLRLDTSITNILIWTSSGTNPPASPTALTATAANPQIKLAWNDSVAATSYNIKRSTSPAGPFTNILANVATTNFTDTAVTIGPTYYYVVSALDQFGESTHSIPASASLFVPGYHPSITQTLLQDGTMLISGTGGQPNASYSILASTNVSLPLGQWSPIGTSAFNNAGAFTYTSPPAPNSPQLYYRLQTP
jgi:hypothetical protein